MHTITGGTRPGGGTNLFHSFGNFNVPANNIANFLNETSLPTTNILGRVTGGNVSNIFGTVQTTGFGNANLFLMNPAGFLFGPNATVNVGGMITFASADYLRLADGGRFNASLNPTVPDLLTAAPVSAFGFLGSNPGAITVQGSQFTVTEGTAISLVGGDITVQSGTLSDGTVQPAKMSAPGGHINLVSVGSAGEIAAPDLLPPPGMRMGSINLSEGSMLDVSSDAAGTVKIRGGQLVMDQATISADTANANGAPVAIDINIAGDMSISAVDVPALTARTSGSGDAGAIRISSQNLDVIATALENPVVSVLDTHTSGTGKAGDIHITTIGDLRATGDQSAIIMLADSGTIGPDGGQGGNVTINARNVSLERASISTGDFVALNLFEEAAGSGGNLIINAETLNVVNANIATGSLSGGNGGDITIATQDVDMTLGSILDANGLVRGGTIQIIADRLRMSETQTDTSTGTESGGGFAFTGKVAEFREGSTIQSSTFAEGNAGPITLTATESLTFADSTSGDAIRPSGLFTTAIVGTGNAAGITVNTPLLQLTGGARFDATTRTPGQGGNITINADTIAISGERSSPILEGPLFGLVTSLASGIYSRTVQSRSCGGGCGNAGPISVTTGSLSLNQGGRIDNSTTSVGMGGDITINTGQTSIAGTTTNGAPSGVFTTVSAAGSGGHIVLTAGQSVTISNGASVSASSTGPGNAGNISINVGQQLVMQNGTVKTEAAQAGGGNISIQAVDIVRLGNSTISTSVLGGSGSGGNITIDPNVVLLQNSQILAQAVQGAGGNILITTNLLLPDANSTISASSQFGQQGTITIQSPIAPASGKIVPLSQKPLLATSLLNQRCAALAAGEFSSFTVAGRDSLPTEPGGWLTSPMANVGSGAGLEARGEGLPSSPYPLPHWGRGDSEGVLSLRQIAPSGFLTQSFAADELIGCGS